MVEIWDALRRNNSCGQTNRLSAAHLAASLAASSFCGSWERPQVNPIRPRLTSPAWQLKCVWDNGDYNQTNELSVPFSLIPECHDDITVKPLLDFTFCWNVTVRCFELPACCFVVENGEQDIAIVFWVVLAHCYAVASALLCHSICF